jgi:hypothetical protein
MYVPHILPMQAGQILQIYSNDPLSHNIRPIPKLNPEWNKSQRAGSMPIHTSWDKSEFIEVRHPSVDARLLRGSENFPLRSDGRQRKFQLEGAPAWQIHDYSLARAVRITTPRGHGGWNRNQEYRFRLKSKPFPY